MLQHANDGAVIHLMLERPPHSYLNGFLKNKNIKEILTDTHSNVKF